MRPLSTLCHIVLPHMFVFQRNLRKHHWRLLWRTGFRRGSLQTPERVVPRGFPQPVRNQVDSGLPFRITCSHAVPALREVEQADAILQEQVLPTFQVKPFRANVNVTCKQRRHATILTKRNQLMSKKQNSHVVSSDSSVCFR